jgi:hypothetical protein
LARCHVSLSNHLVSVYLLQPMGPKRDAARFGPPAYTLSTFFRFCDLAHLSRILDMRSVSITLISYSSWTRLDAEPNIP